MQLLTPKEVAKELFVTVGMIHYWIRKGRLKKHPTSNGYNYLVDLEEARFASNWKKNVAEANPDLITKKEAADMLFLTERSVSYHISVGHLKRYYVLGDNRHYLLHKDEVVELLYSEPYYKNEDRNEKLRQLALKQKKDKKGKFCK